MGMDWRQSLLCALRFSYYRDHRRFSRRPSLFPKLLCAARAAHLAGLLPSPAAELLCRAVCVRQPLVGGARGSWGAVDALSLFHPEPSLRRNARNAWSDVVARDRRTVLCFLGAHRALREKRRAVTVVDRSLSRLTVHSTGEYRLSDEGPHPDSP